MRGSFDADFDLVAFHIPSFNENSPLQKKSVNSFLGADNGFCFCREIWFKPLPPREPGVLKYTDYKNNKAKENANGNVFHEFRYLIKLAAL